VRLGSTNRKAATQLITEVQRGVSQLRNPVIARVFRVLELDDIT